MNQKDEALLEFLLQSTATGKLRWIPTADENELTAPVRGKYSVNIKLTRSGRNILTLLNAEGITLLALTDNDDVRVNNLFELARRRAYNVDTVIDEIIGGAEK